MNDFSERLLQWYDRCARTLPWRGIRDPYRTWVSEIMLQQTRVDTVIPYYTRFLERFPTVAALAGAPESDVLKQWEGLGYYSRARNLWHGAQKVAEAFGGAIPSDPAVLRTIPGIGSYTAGAIASIAFDIPVPAVDGNVIRVLSRVFGIREDITGPGQRKALESLAASLVPPVRAGDHNQAIMDLGATVCTPGTPDCVCCPLAAICDAYCRGDAADLPCLPDAKPPRVIHYAVPLLFSGNNVLMRCRTEKLLQGLWCFPMLEGTEDIPALRSLIRKKLRLQAGEPHPAGHARHVFTHLVWEMDLYLVSVAPGSIAPPGYVFVSPEELETVPVPTAMRAAVMLAHKKTGDPV